VRFVSDISIWWLLPWLGISIFIAHFLYSKENWIKELGSKWMLIFKSLRASGLFLLGVLFIGILFEAISIRVEKPVFITMVDNSSSMKNYKDSATVKSKIESFNNKLIERFGDKFELHTITVGSEVKSPGKIDFNESTSALSEGFESIHSNFYSRNIGGIAFISDGNFNKGSNPLYSAEKIDLTPVFTVGVGDTTPKKDQYIKNIASNEIAFLKNKFPVEVDLEGIKMGKSNVTVSILNNGKSVASQSVNFSNGTYDYKHVSFLLEADKVGYQQYTVSISTAGGEYTYSNNTRNFYIEILDARSKVLLLAGAPHPDVAALKSVIEKDENLDVTSFLVKEWKRDLKKVDLIIYHEPGIQYDESVMTLIRDAKIPVLYCVGPNTTNSIIQKLKIGLITPNGNQFDEVQGKINTGFQKFEVSTELQNSMNYYPPLKTKFGDVKLAAGNDVLLFQRIGSIQKNDPMIYFGENQNVKFGVIYGEGIWKWKMNEYIRSSESKNFTELIQKISQYLVVKQNTSALRVTFPKRFTIDEEVEVKAEFYNESMELITKPIIELKLKDEKNKSDKYQFGAVSNFYKLSLGKLKPGKYEWTANCKYNGKSYSKSGVFIVENIQLENIESAADHNLLNQIAKQSNGQFYELKNIDQLLNDIEKRKDIAEMSYSEASFNDLIDYKWLFFLIILIFGTEWFLRRWFGGY
jgi:hypothetical protein